MDPGCLRKKRWKNEDDSVGSAWSAGEYCLSVRDTGSSSGRSMQQEIIWEREGQTQTSTHLGNTVKTVKPALPRHLPAETNSGYTKITGRLSDQEVCAAEYVYQTITNLLF